MILPIMFLMKNHVWKYKAALRLKWLPIVGLECIYFEKVSLISDMWSYSSLVVSFLSLIWSWCHGFTKDFQRKYIVLKAEVLEGQHTEDYISKTFQSMLEEWRILKENIHYYAPVIYLKKYIISTVEHIRYIPSLKEFVKK